MSDESNKSTQWQHSWLVNNSQSLLEDQVSNLSLSLSLTQSSEEAETDPKEGNKKQADSDDEKAKEKSESSDEENLDEALISILEKFSDED